MSTETATSPYLREARYDSDRIHAFVEATPDEVRAKVRKHPLTDEQAGAFYALLDHGNGDFLWSNTSTTERLLAALANKGLAIRGETTDRWGNVRARYTPEPGAHAAFHARKRAQEQARNEAGEREAQANREKHARLTAALEQDVQTLLSALQVARQQGAILEPALDRAEARVRAMGEQGVSVWQGRW